jgi:hypothetical protein
MTPTDRPDETLAPLPMELREEQAIARVLLDSEQTEAVVKAGGRLFEELDRERRLSAEKDAQLEYAASFAKQMERVWNEATAELAAIEKALEGSPRDGLLLIDRITALVVQRNADDERCKWWAQNDADLNQRITLADNEVVRLHLALAEKDAKLAALQQDRDDFRAAVANLVKCCEAEGLKTAAREQELAEQSATLARLEQERDTLRQALHDLGWTLPR